MLMRPSCVTRADTRFPYAPIFRAETFGGCVMTFVAVRIPSLSPARIYYRTVPNTQASARRAFVRDRPEKAAWKEPLSNRPYVLLCLAAGLQMVLLMGIPQWFPAYMERSYGKIGRAHV